VVVSSQEGVAPILVTSERDYVIADRIEAPRIAEEEVVGLGFEIVDHPWYRPQDRASLVEKLARGKLLTDTGKIGGELARLRYSLNENEIERYRLLGKDTAAALAGVCGSLEVGEAEFEIAARAAKGVYDIGATPVVVLIAVDDRISKFRHPIPTPKKLQRYAMVVICARKWGLIVSSTRLVHFGPLPRELKQKHDAVVEVDATFIANTIPGTRISDVFQCAVRAYEQAGYGQEWKLHHQGGATGYAGRDFKGTPDCEEVVQPNQAYAWNPSIAGTKSEDTIIATASGQEILSLADDWPMIEVEVQGKILPRAAIAER
jgi:Xaa-Pro aminopeptidase